MEIMTTGDSTKHVLIANQDDTIHLAIADENQHPLSTVALSYQAAHDIADALFTAIHKNDEPIQEPTPEPEPQLEAE